MTSERSPSFQGPMQKSLHRAAKSLVILEWLSLLLFAAFGRLIYVIPSGLHFGSNANKSDFFLGLDFRVLKFCLDQSSSHFQLYLWQDLDSPEPQLRLIVKQTLLLNCRLCSTLHFRWKALAIDSPLRRWLSNDANRSLLSLFCQSKFLLLRNYKSPKADWISSTFHILSAQPNQFFLLIWY